MSRPTEVWRHRLLRKESYTYKKLLEAQVADVVKPKPRLRAIATTRMLEAIVCLRVTGSNADNLFSWV
jgi:hypothetical protein